MQRRHCCGLQSQYKLKGLQEESFGNARGVRNAREQNLCTPFKKRPQNHLEISLNPILNMPQLNFCLKEVKSHHEKQQRHHSTPITLRNLRKSLGCSDDRKDSRVNYRAYLKIPKQLQSTIQMINIEKRASIERSKINQVKGQRFSESCLKQNSEIPRKTRWTHIKALQRLENRNSQESLLKINVSKFKSQKWKLFKKKKYVHSDIFSIKPSKINRNCYHIRQSTSLTIGQAKMVKLYQSNQRQSKNLERPQNQDGIIQQIDGFSPWSSTID